MFGQDTGVVVDVGTFSVRAGFAGEDAPTANFRISNNGFGESMKDGLIYNLESFELLW